MSQRIELHLTCYSHCREIDNREYSFYRQPMPKINQSVMVVYGVWHQISYTGYPICHFKETFPWRRGELTSEKVLVSRWSIFHYWITLNVDSTFVYESSVVPLTSFNASVQCISRCPKTNIFMSYLNDMKFICDTEFLSFWIESFHFWLGFQMIVRLSEAATTTAAVLHTVIQQVVLDQTSSTLT